jgi:hypothetical protein
VIDLSGVFALDGHDGSGKTSLARWLAASVNGTYQRPFSGALGGALLRAGERGDVATVIALGEEGIGNAISAAGSGRPVILDRGWMTVASFVQWEQFYPAWRLWMPTALCWADLTTTLERLGRRAEKAEDAATHSGFIEIYRGLAERTGSCVVPTGLLVESQCRDALAAWLRSRPAPPDRGCPLVRYPPSQLESDPATIRFSALCQSRGAGQT